MKQMSELESRSLCEDEKLLVSEVVMSRWLMYFGKFLEENGASTGSSMGNGNQQTQALR